MYGAESWALRKDDIRRLESCEMWLWRKILNISWTEKVSNDEVLRRVNEDRAIIPSINKRQRTWIDHTLMHGNLLPLIIEGRRPPGRPRTGMLDRIKKLQLLSMCNEESQGEKIIRMDLPLGRTHTPTTENEND